MAIFKAWVVLVFVTTVLAGTIYTTVQQVYRQGANDPQVQMAEDTATALEHLTPMNVPAKPAVDVQLPPIDAYVPSSVVDIATSLSPYIIIYDHDREPIAGNGRLNGVLPTLPSGVFAAAAKFAAGCKGIGPIEPADWKGCQSGENRITWQPEAGVRSAIVVGQASWGNTDGYVVAGRSLREVEKRENSLFLFVGFGWGVTVVGSLFLLWVFRKVRPQTS